jgi:predicted PurR-regulated permease PerM
MPIYFPIIIAMILAFILNPLVNYISCIGFGPNKRCFGRGIAAICAFLLMSLFLLIVGTFVLLPFIHEFDKFIVDLPKLVSKIQNVAFQIQQGAKLLDFPANINALIDQSIASIASFSADVAKRLLQAAFGFATGIVELVVVPVLTYYFLKDWSILKDKIISLFTVESRGKVRKLIEEMGVVISGYIRGQVFISMIIGIFVFSGMYMLGIDYPLVLGILAACTESIPIIGPIFGSIPAILLAYLISPTLAFKVIIFYIIVQLIENQIVVPNIMGHTIDLHPVVVIISLLIGGQLWGIIGMMLAVPIAALLRVLIRQLWITNER